MSRLFRSVVKHSARSTESEQAGFTLIEVVMALVVLGGSLVVLLGLQSSLITRNIRNGMQEHAMLMTRQLLAPLEAGVASSDTVEISGTFREVYAKLMTDVGQLEKTASTDKAFAVRYSITPWQIEGFEADVMRKVTVTIRWGEASADSTTTNLFIPVIS